MQRNFVHNLMQINYGLWIREITDVSCIFHAVNASHIESLYLWIYIPD
jgi:hypothetical protein